jgi:hypothetical protein
LLNVGELPHDRDVVDARGARIYPSVAVNPSALSAHSAADVGFAPLVRVTLSRSLRPANLIYRYR